MPEKPPSPKPADNTYSDEETAKRRDATVRAMIGMKPKPRSADNPAKPKRPLSKKRGA